ncbi:HAMP domain-containing sensor histidine kinase [Longimicrobium sp.]|uniref:sensor histidine kinase n=1 Tax=Longimicrobium sp. TaxID=2029185 RepID=UPI002CBB73F5|nr:HAMP domain-containing sensor histidine kinase [Longimicrobium sp.]HSU15952.1 HAMP domain-containing sensor histidine kinase [Longimicrobium sp.]
MAQETVTAPEPSATAATAPMPDARVRELESLRSMAVAAADTVDPEEIFSIVCRTLAELAGAELALAAIPIFDTPRQWCGAADPSPDAAERLLALADEARARGRTAVASADGTSAVAVPLAGEGAGGALVAGWQGDREVDAETVRIVETVALQAAAAFRNATRYDALRQAAVRRERFFSAMSHDLRTPITAIMGYSELLQDGIMGDLDPHQLEMVERICQVSGHLAQLVNDVLDIAKLDAGRMEFSREPVTLGELVEEAMVAVEPQARSKGLEIRLEIDGHRDELLEVDAGRVRQILVNLLSNAVKFTDDGAVTLAASVEGGRGWIRVSDTGPGIPGGSEEAVFEEFLQIASGTKAKREPGSGLGLAISRRLARAMGGDLTAGNADPGGAAFTLHLPGPG